MTISWAGRLQTVGATPAEVAAIQASYDGTDPNVQESIDSLIGSIDNAGVSQMLTNWRAGKPFAGGLPGGPSSGRAPGPARRRVDEPDPPAQDDARPGITFPVRFPERDRRAQPPPAAESQSEEGQVDGVR